MSKNIKVTDEIYARLEEQAKRGYRPITSHLEFLLDYFEAGEKNKTENPAWDIPKPSCEIGSGSQANNQRPSGEHIGRREVFTVPQLISKIEDIRKKADEEAEYCQDPDTIKRIYAEADAEIQPLQAQIDSMI